MVISALLSTIRTLTYIATLITNLHTLITASSYLLRLHRLCSDDLNFSVRGEDMISLFLFNVGTVPIRYSVI